MAASGFDVRDHRPLDLVVDVRSEVYLRPPARLPKLPDTSPDKPKGGLFVRRGASTRHHLLQMPLDSWQSVSVRRIRVLRSVRVHLLWTGVLLHTAACASVPNPGHELLDSCPGPDPQSCSSLAGELYESDQTRAGYEAADVYNRQVTARWIWAQQCDLGHRDSCFRLATTRRSAGFPPRKAPEEILLKREATMALVQRWQGGARVLWKGYGDVLKEGEKVSVFRVLGDDALVRWSPWSSADAAWVPATLLATDEELRSIRTTETSLARIQRSLERKVPLFSTEANEALEELASLEPYVPEHQTAIETLRSQLLNAREAAHRAETEREKAREADEERRAAQRQAVLVTRLEPDIKEAQALLRERRDVFGIWIARGQGRHDVVTGRDRFTGLPFVAANITGVGVRIRRTTGHEVVLETGEVRLSLWADGVNARFIPRRVAGGVGQCLFVCSSRCTDFQAHFMGQDCGSYALEVVDFEDWEGAMLPTKLRGPVIATREGAFLPIEVAGLALKLVALQEAERSGGALPQRRR